MKKIIILIILLLVGGALFWLFNNQLAIKNEFGKRAFQDQKYQNAINIFTEVLSKDKNNQDAYFFRGATYSARQEWEKCISDFSTVISLNSKYSNYSNAYWSRGYCYANSGVLSEAIDDYTRSLELGTNFTALVYENRAKAYLNNLQIDEAEKDWRTVLQLDPNNTMAREALEAITQAKTDPNYDPKLFLDSTKNKKY